MKNIMLNKLFYKVFVLFLLPFFLFSCSIKNENPANIHIIAFSMKNAGKLLNQGSNNSTEADTLAGISRIAGYVLDKENNDIILIGLVDKNTPAARFEDLITALRSRIIYDEYPLVSIDPVADTYFTRNQKIRFDGHLENTHFGDIFLKCDVLLKHYTLELIESIKEVPSYRSLFEQDIIEGIKKSGYSVKNVSWAKVNDANSTTSNYAGSQKINQEEYQARFWFYPLEPINYQPLNPDNVFLIEDLRIGLKAEEVYSRTKAKIYAKEKFASDWTTHYDELCKKYPELKYIKTLYDFTALANSLNQFKDLIGKSDFLKYLLYDYKIQNIPTPSDYKLVETIGTVDIGNGMVNLISISGGIQFDKEIKMLNYGDFEKLKDIVVKTRPNNSSLYWVLPVQGWIMLNTNDLELYQLQEKNKKDNSGSYVTGQSVLLDKPKPNQTISQNSFNGFSPKQTEPLPLKGVSMKMEVNNNSFKKGGDELHLMRDKILNDVRK
jgi:hypothetical protein